MSKSTCEKCREVFFSVSGFNMHRIGGYGDAIYDGRKVIGHTKPDRRCLSALEMQNLGMSKNKFGVWITGTFDASIFKKKESEQ